MYQFYNLLNLVVPCCLLFGDGVKLELELELAGLGCSDLKGQKKENK